MAIIMINSISGDTGPNKSVIMIDSFNIYYYYLLAAVRVSICVKG